MFPPRVPTVLALVLSLLTGCHPPPSSGGTAQGAALLTVQVPPALPEYVSRVTVTVSGPDMASLSMDLAFNNGAWSGLLSDVPPGPHRTFSAQAFTRSTTPRFGGQVEDVTVTGHSTDLVNMDLREDYSYVWPTFTSGSQSSLTAKAGQTLDFEVEATTPSHSALTFAWAATTGTFGAATSSGTRSRVSWTAPSQCVIPGRTQVIVAIVTNDVGNKVRRGFTVEGLPTCPNGGWTLTGLLNVSREGQASALLPDGKVLISGGWPAIEGTAEVYEPANGAWRLTSSMATGRQWHTTTPLPDGKVLVAGGMAWSGTLMTAEVYDPATGTWSPTGSMAQHRQRHTATPLPDGKVLVVGGYMGPGSPVLTEVYDPATGTWSPTGSLSTQRSGHTATPLPDGKVLITGGITGNSYTAAVSATAEVYDPATGSWSLTGSMASPRSGHTATLLPDGKVLVAGGVDCTLPHPLEAEVYDPATGSWSPTGSMVTSHTGHTATLLPTGRVLVVGGANDDSRDALDIYYALAEAEVYDPVTGTWHRISSMSIRSGLWPTAELLPTGKVLVVAGGNQQSRLQAEVYDPAAEP